MKVCIKCNKEFEENEEHFQKLSNGKLNNKCKGCVKQYKKEYQQKNKKRLSNQKKEYYNEHREATISHAVGYKNEHREFYRGYQKEWYQLNKERIDIYEAI